MLKALDTFELDNDNQKEMSSMNKNEIEVTIRRWNFF